MPYVGRLRFMASTESGALRSLGREEVLPVAAAVRLQGPGSVLTAARLALERAQPGEAPQTQKKAVLS